MTSPDAIPEDILVAAENALDMMLCNCKEAGDVRQDSIQDIARALLAERTRATKAERDRCAQVARRFTNQPGPGGMHVRRAAWEMLDAIRAPVHTPSPEEQGEAQ